MKEVWSLGDISRGMEDFRMFLSVNLMARRSHERAGAERILR